MPRRSQRAQALIKYKARARERLLYKFIQELSSDTESQDSSDATTSSGSILDAVIQQRLQQIESSRYVGRMEIYRKPSDGMRQQIFGDFLNDGSQETNINDQAVPNIPWTNEA